MWDLGDLLAGLFMHILLLAAHDCSRMAAMLTCQRAAERHTSLPRNLNPWRPAADASSASADRRRHPPCRYVYANCQASRDGCIIRSERRVCVL